MAEPFECPNCGAPIKYNSAGQEDAQTISCPYCNSSVIIPPELRKFELYESVSCDEPDEPQLRGSSQQQMMDAVVYLARSGVELEAMRYYCQLTGCSQADAKQVVENIKAGIYPPGFDSASSQTDSDSLTAQQVEHIQRLMHSGQKIEAIKFYREIADCSRAEAEKAVEKY